MQNFKNMNSYVTEGVFNHLNYFFERIYAEKMDLIVNGIHAYNPKSQFTEGKVVNACTYVYQCLDDSDPSKADSAKKLAAIIDLMATREFKTWGMLNCIIGLYRLHQDGHLNDVVSAESLALFKQKLDWRTFVNEQDLTLISFPANFYGVAFGIAKYRELLGFEDGNWSEKLLEKLLQHVDNFSGEFSFMDETNGQGRFDRYSILIPAEICAMLANTGCEVPNKLTVMLRKSCDIYMNIANSAGSGFSYGRSIGAYGDTAALEVLSIGAKLGVLTESELPIAYTYNTLTVKRFIDFWLDSDTKSVNMWFKGRRTDAYRNENRILGENLSLAMQIIGAHQNWIDAGFEQHDIIDDFQNTLNTLPQCTKFKFSDDQYERSLYTIRDKHNVFTLPLINGGDTYYKESAYLPIPNQFGVLASPANSSYPFLLPKLIFKDGIEAMPIVYIENITDNLNNKVDSNVNRNVNRNVGEAVSEAAGHKINFQLSAMAQLEGKGPTKMDGIVGQVQYEFSSGQINFHIKLTFNQQKISTVDSVVMQVASFSKQAVARGIGLESIIEYEKQGAELETSQSEVSGFISDIRVQGFDNCTIEQTSANSEFHTPAGALNNVATFVLKESLDELSRGNELTFSWVINYR